jgi:hypothetical protein
VELLTTLYGLPNSEPVESEDAYCNYFGGGGGGGSKKTHASQIFQGKVNIWNEMWTCECKVSDSIVKGVNKTVEERLQTTWLDAGENVLRQLQII